MAGESCNLEKDEAEILKPSSSPSSTSSSPTPSSSTLPPTLLLKPCQDSPNPRADTSETSVEAYSLSNPNEHTDPLGESKPMIRFINRCSACRKKVGLTGFRCRCGYLFCGSHRYSDTHDCSFDYKAFGREEITKANPVVRATKIIKI